MTGSLITKTLMDLVPKGENNKRAGHSSSSPVKCSCCLPLSALATPGIAPLYIVSCWVIENYMKRYLGQFWGVFMLNQKYKGLDQFLRYLFRKNFVRFFQCFWFFIACSFLIVHQMYRTIWPLTSLISTHLDY